MKKKFPETCDSLWCSIISIEIATEGQETFASYASEELLMWRIATIVALVLSIGVGTAFAQGKQGKRQGPPKGKPNIEEVFKTKDKDHDGKLSKEEFLGNVKDPEREKAVEARFKAIDTNNDGFITLDELKAAMEKRGQGAGKPKGKQATQKVKITTVA
jgi:hypothetical protein